MRNTIEYILKHYDEEINKFKGGDKGIVSARIVDIATCYFFLEDFHEAYYYSKYLVDIALEHKRLEDYAPYYIIDLLSKAKIENNIEFAKEARHNLFKYVRGERKETIIYDRPSVDLYSISDLLANDINADIKQVLRIGGWPLKNSDGK